ncbi:MAG: hypothetical protein ACO3ND_05055 [Opitutales bacterium]
MSRLIQRSKRVAVAVVAGLIVGLLAQLGVGAWRDARLAELADSYRRAHEARDIAALESLFCLDGVTPEARARLRLALAQELDQPLARVSVDEDARGHLTQAVDTWRRMGMKMTLPFAGAALQIEHATSDRLTATHLIGRDGLRYRLVWVVRAE